VIAKTWLGGLKSRTDILLIQELKAYEFRLLAALEYILPTYQSVIAFPNEGCGGTALLIYPRLEIVNSRVMLRGVAWAAFKHDNDTYYVGSIYSPNTAT
jgi:exonuclease III